MFTRSLTFSFNFFFQGNQLKMAAANDQLSHRANNDSIKVGNIAIYVSAPTCVSQLGGLAAILNHLISFNFDFWVFITVLGLKELCNLKVG